MVRYPSQLFALALLVVFIPMPGRTQPVATTADERLEDFQNKVPLLVRSCQDFEITGAGTHPEWNKVPWTSLVQLDQQGAPYESKFKILYSTSGIYLLFYGEDRKITTGAYEDFGALYNGDVFEVFFHPDSAGPVYFEYEINPLGKHLVLALSRLDSRTVGWVPSHPERKQGAIQRKVHITGMEKAAGDTMESWSAEIFLPYIALGLLPKVPPQRGTTWHANFCRLDYDSGGMVKWSWSPGTRRSFHELEQFQWIQFE